MINGEKIGLGIITCDREDYFRKCVNFDYTSTDYVVIVDDGKSKIDQQWLLDNVKLPSHVVISNKDNLGVGKNKNMALKIMIDEHCDHLFLMEDDMLIKDSGVFEAYIRASKASGIQHFNYGPGSPFNRKQQVKFDLHNRHELDQKSEPNPRMTINYNDISIDLFEHTVAMFSYYSRKCIDKVGYIDESYTNAWEHVDHTYMVIKAGMHPPFWYFADIHNSTQYIEEQENAIDNSSIACDDEQWKKNVYGGREIYKKKHGHYPNQPPVVTVDDVYKSLKSLKP